MAFYVKSGSGSACVPIAQKLISAETGWSDDNILSNLFIGTEGNETSSDPGDICKNAKCNVFVGGNTATKLCSSCFTTAVGHSSLACLTTGSCNSVLGTLAGFNITTGYRNTLMGDCAGCSLVSGYQNTMIGSSAGRQNTGNLNGFIGYQSGEYNTGSSNIFIGQCSGRGCTTGTNSGGCNIAIGNQSGECIESGTHNLFIGNSSGQGTSARTITGSNNLFLGNCAGKQIGPGSSNIAIGNCAAYNIRCGDGNIIIGKDSACTSELLAAESDYVNNNVVIGSCSFNMGLNAAATCRADCNVIIGNCAVTDASASPMGAVVIGHSAARAIRSVCNVAGGVYIGWQSGYSQTTNAETNTYIGTCAGRCATTASGNTLIGLCAGHPITSGGCNTIIGHCAGYNAKTTMAKTTIMGVNTQAACSVTDNVAIGGFSGTGACRNTVVGNGAGICNTFNGNENVFVGYYAGTCNVTGSTPNCNVYIGQCAGGGTGCNNIAIGWCSGKGTKGLKDLSANISDAIVIGNTCINNFYTKMSTSGSGLAVQWNSSTYELIATSSSRRYKENIRPFLSGLDYVLKMNPVTFTYIERPEETDPILGLIAEDLDEIGLTELVNYNNDNLPESISYDKISVVLINAVKELDGEIKKSLAKLEALESAA